MKQRNRRGTSKGKNKEKINGTSDIVETMKLQEGHYIKKNLRSREIYKELRKEDKK